MKDYKYFMREAIEEAQKGEGIVSPNPMVGALIVKDNKILSKGYHGEDLKKHAEIIALEKASNVDLSDSVLFITLEPCCHYGNTPPCTDAIINSGIKKIVIAQIDPNPKISGKGVEILRNKGINVKIGVLNKEAKYQIRFFQYWITNLKPYFFAKLAISNDGYYANEGNVLISHPKTKKMTREMRNKFDAIIIGKKTLLIDNPHLGSSKKDPLRIILCQTADFSVKNLQVFRDENVLIACREKTAECDFNGKFIFYDDLTNLKLYLFDIGVQSVLIEGGGEIIKNLLNCDLIDEMLIVKSNTYLLNSGKQITIPKTFALDTEIESFDDLLKFYKK